MMITTGGTSIDAAFSGPQTSATDDSLLGSSAELGRRQAWGRVIDEKLIEWGRVADDADDESMPVSQAALAVANILATSARDGNISWPAPSAVVPDVDGGISIRWGVVGRNLMTLEIAPDGSAECIYTVNSQIISRNQLS